MMRSRAPFRFRTGLVAAAVLAPLTLGLTACGDDDPESVTTSTDGGSTEAPVATCLVMSSGSPGS